MKRKSLLLLVPFAVAAMAGCTPVEKKDGQCDSATVTLNKESLTLEKGETYQLEATISVENCPINWSTSAPGVATVEDGLVTAVGKGTATISVNGSAFCEVTVTEGDTPVPDDPVHLGTEADPYDSADAACVASKLPEGSVTPDSFYIKDTVKKLEETFNPSFGNYSFNLGHDFLGWRLKKGPNKEAFNDGDIAVGDEVVVYAQIQKFHQNATEDKPARNVLETKDGYVVSVKKNTPVKEIESVDGIVQEGLPTQVVVGGSISPSLINLNVTYTTGETGTVHPDKVEFDNTKAAENVVVSCTYGNFPPVTFTINVVNEVTPEHAGTESDPYTPGDAAIVAAGLEQTTDSKNPIATEQQYYIKGTVSKLVKDFEAKYGSYSFWLGNNEFEVWQIYNGENKAKFNEGDIAPGYEVTIKAKIMNFKGTPENTTDSYVVSVNKGDVPVSPTINLSTYSATIDINASTTITAAVTNCDEAVTWSVTSGADIVSITPSDKSVSVVGVAVGKAVVRATLGTTGLYKECNVTVKGEPPVIEGTVLDFESELTSTSGTKDDISYASEKGEGQNPPVYNTDYNELRLYAKNTLTISASGITKITFDYNGCYTEGDKDPCHKATGDIVEASVGSISGGVWTGSADSVTFTMSDSGQVHVHKIGVIHEEAEPRVLDSITVSEEHRTFEVGDAFVGETVTAHYENADDRTVTAIFSGYDMSSAGKQNVSVSYTENDVTKTTSYEITVNVPEEKTEYNFTAESQTSYTDDDKSGATIEITGATGYEADRGVAWNKSEGSVKISGLKAGTIKKITLDVSHNKTTEPTVSVSVGGNAYGSAFTIEKVNHVSAEFTGDVTAGDVIVSISKTTDGSIWLKKVTITYEAGEPPVIEPAVNKVTVSPSTAKLDLVETTSTTLVATVDAVGGADESVTWSVSPEGIVEVENGVVTAKAEGSATVTATSVFDGTKSASCEVEVLGQPAPQPELDSISVDTTNAKLTYTEGESFDKTGLVVTAHYTNGGQDKVLQASEYTVDPADALAASADPVQVTVTYEGKTANFNITVNAQTAEKGTAENPFTVLEALTETRKLTQDPYWSSKRYYVTGQVKDFTSSSGKCTLTDGTNDFVVYKSDVQGKTVNVGDIATFEGWLRNYNGNNPQMTSQNSTAYSALPTLVSVVTPKIVSLGLVTAPATIGKGGTLNTANVSVAVTYDNGSTGSVHPDSIDLDTSVIGKEIEGTVHVGTLIATFTIEVLEEAAEPTTITKTITEIGTANKWESGNQYTSFDLDSNISVSTNAESGKNTGKYYTQSDASKPHDWRIYQNENYTATITAANGKKIKSVTIVYNIKDNGILVYNSENYNSGSTINNLDLTSFVFSCGATKEAKGKILITSITVVYE